MDPLQVRIGSRVVGDGAPVLVIAEAGVNHDGNVQKALALVDAAASAGADVVKFQMFRADELVTADAVTAAYQHSSGAHSQRELLARLELNQAAFERIVARCRTRGIGFLATPFGPHDVERLVALGVGAIKIASTDLDNPVLVRSAAATGLPLLVSTGAATAEEIDAAVARLRPLAAGRLVLLHCISGYPAPLDSANLRAVGTLRARAGVPTGFSDHTRSTEIAGWAVAAGACVLEKHMTLDRTAPGPDHAMSLTPEELAAYVRVARSAERALGSGALGFTEVEADVRRVARKSIVAAGDIPAGTVLAPEHLTVKRPGGGLPPTALESVYGRRTRCAIAADTRITPELLE
ncbi:MAG: N-acetylneuraminate synthase family protein [Phycisphaerales bacterium]|nr:N-acetylneuraminate synthase family protein [Phycisphaerales bacterium]